MHDARLPVARRRRQNNCDGNPQNQTFTIIFSCSSIRKMYSLDFDFEPNSQIRDQDLYFLYGDGDSKGRAPFPPLFCVCVYVMETTAREPHASLRRQHTTLTASHDILWHFVLNTFMVAETLLLPPSFIGSHASRAWSYLFCCVYAMGNTAQKRRLPLLDKLRPSLPATTYFHFPF